MVEIGEPEVAGIAIDFDQPGTQFAVHGVDQLPGDQGFESLVDWGPAIARYQAESGSDTYALPEPQSHRYWLVLLERLPRDDQGAQRVEIAEIRFIGADGEGQAPATPSPEAEG